jgi:hypothetical protein
LLTFFLFVFDVLVVDQRWCPPRGKEYEGYGKLLESDTKDDKTKSSA